ncbi:MAG: ADOP family duplicated permease [Gemmatimonadaceae bacterium]
MTPNSFRLAARSLLRRPRLAVIVTLTLALSIAAVSSVFSLFDPIFLRAMPLPEVDRLVRLSTRDLSAGPNLMDVSLPDFDDMQRELRAFDKLSAYVIFPSTLSVRTTTRAVEVAFSTPELFGIIGAQPVHGRFFGPSENVLYGDVRKAVISHALWQDMFNGRPDAVGQTVQLRGQSYEIVGVMPASINYPDRVDVWAPLMARYSSFPDRWWERRDMTMHTVIGRLATGRSIEQASADVETLMGEIRRKFPDESRERYGVVRSLRDVELGPLRPYALAATLAALLVLAVASLNIVNLLVAQAVARERETLVQVALGASGRHLTTRIVAEQLILAALAAGIGVALSVVATRWLAMGIPVKLPYWLSLTVDGRVLGFAIMSALGLAGLISLAPLRHLHRLDVALALRHASAGSGEARGMVRWRKIALAGQVALSMAVVTTASLILDSMRRIERAETGMRTENLLVVRGSRYVPNLTPDQEAVVHTDEWLRVARRLEQVPGVKSVSFTDDLPFEPDRLTRWSIRMYTREHSTDDSAPMVPISGAFVPPGFFATLGMSLLEGRDVRDDDRRDTPQVVIISEPLARLLFPGRSAIGQAIKFGADPDYPWATVIGVASPVRWTPEETGAAYEAYFSFRQHPTAYPRFVIHTVGDPAALRDVVVRTIRETSPEFGIEAIKPMAQARRDSVWRRVVAGWVLSVFGILALVLASTGVYGVAVHHVTTRQRELSLRAALGCTPRELCWHVVRETTLVVAAGIAVGAVLSLAGARLVQPLLWNASAVSPVALAASAVVLLVVALTATVGPAFRTLRISPMQVLREE